MALLDEDAMVLPGRCPADAALLALDPKGRALGVLRRPKPVALPPRREVAEVTLLGRVAGLVVAVLLTDLLDTLPRRAVAEADLLRLGARSLETVVLLTDLDDALPPRRAVAEVGLLGRLALLLEY